MNCQEIENVGRDVAAGQVMDATLREEALLHAGSCASCATRLADEHALTQGLRQLTLAAGEAEAPARIEASLMAAFREAHSGEPAPVFASSRVTNRRWVYIGVGVAAALVIAVLFTVIASRPHREKIAPQQAVDSPGTTLNAPPSQPTPGSLAGRPAGRERKPTGRGKNLARSDRKADDGAESNSDVEIATDFFPLVNRESLAEMDSGQVVRVELPRTALMSFGLPMNMDRAGERIKADVVVGDDGLARAIRFVR
jgi:hypothetical protein